MVIYKYRYVDECKQIFIVYKEKANNDFVESCRCGKISMILDYDQSVFESVIK